MLGKKVLLVYITLYMLLGILLIVYIVYIASEFVEGIKAVVLWNELGLKEKYIIAVMK